MRIKIFSILLCTILFLKVTGQDIYCDSILRKVYNLEKEEKFELAYDFLSKEISNCPDRWFEISKELIYINEKLAQYERNLGIFKQAHFKGYFYFIHPQIGKYKPYLSLPEFDKISEEDFRLRDSINKTSKTLYEVVLPNNYKIDSTYPLMFIFHGGGKNMKDSKGHWHSEFLNGSFIKVYLQSYLHFDSN